MATTIPGGVTSNVVGSTSTSDPAMDRMLLERQWELEDYNRLNREKEKQKQYATDMANWQKGEQEAKMKAAYEKIYSPYLQSMWDQQQGKIIGAEGMASGDPRLGSVYKKYGSGLYGEQNDIRVGQKPYEFRQDTNMPADLYQQSLNDAYEMWKAGKMIGIGDTKVTGTNSRLPGGSAGKSV